MEFAQEHKDIIIAVLSFAGALLALVTAYVSRNQTVTPRHEDVAAPGQGAADSPHPRSPAGGMIEVRPTVMAVIGAFLAVAAYSLVLPLVLLGVTTLLAG